MPVLASQRLAAEFLCRQWGRCLLTLSLPQCQGGAQEHPEAEAEVGALEAHTEQPVGRGQGPSALKTVCPRPDQKASSPSTPMDQQGVPTDMCDAQRPVACHYGDVDED